ncbi:MAG: inorganic phosphate transporter [Spirochaetia bacterium]
MGSLFIFLSGGLFLGWSLGANDAANVFGTAVATRMVRFTLAAVIASLAVVTGAVFAGAGAAGTLGRLGAITALPGAFTVTLAAALSVFTMTRAGLPVSTSQAIVGGIIGWNIYAGHALNYAVLSKIVLSWVSSPIIAACFGFLLYFLVRFMLNHISIHIIRRDLYTRIALIISGAFGAYSLGANNIGNVMGVFVPISPFPSVEFVGGWGLSGVQLLFLLGAIAISVGIFTYSQRVMETVGSDIFKLSPITAFIVVLSSAIVLFLFASEGLHDWLVLNGLPALPLVPISSSQAVVGSVIGIGMARGMHNIRFKLVGKIGMGWLATPLVAGVVCYFLLFFMDNLFLLTVK